LLTRGLLPRGLACFVSGHSSIIFRMTEKEMVLKAVRELPDDCSIDEIADRIEFLAAVQKGLDQLDRGEGIPHEEIKRQLASWLTN
jgi:hypothetical protein